MFTFINAAVIFAFGLVVTGIVVLGMVQSREMAQRIAAVEAGRRKGGNERRVA